MTFHEMCFFEYLNETLESLTFLKAPFIHNAPTYVFVWLCSVIFEDTMTSAHHSISHGEKNVLILFKKNCCTTLVKTTHLNFE